MRELAIHAWSLALKFLYLMEFLAAALIIIFLITLAALSAPITWAWRHLQDLTDPS